MTYNEALQKIQRGNCLLFTGAGFSLGAINYKKTDSNLRVASQIAKDLYKLSDVPEEDRDGDLSRASQWFQQKHGSDDIIEFLRKEFTIANISPIQKGIGSFTWRRCYTINYDEVLEKAYLENGNHLTPVTPYQNSSEYKTSNVCIHLNGTISRLNRESIDSEFKLTSKSYTQDYIKNTGWWDIFEDDLLLCEAIFFVGCSLKSDIDLIRLLDRTKSVKEKTFFIVRPDESDINLMTLNELGTTLKIGTNGFLQDISSVPILANPIAKKFNYFTSPEIITGKPKRKRSDFIDLLVKGTINDHLLDFSIKEPDYFPYFIYREKIKSVLDKLEQGNSFFVIHSDLGNGKTVFLKAISYVFHNKGYRVFLLERDAPSAIDELAFICNEINEQTIIIVESYIDKISLLKRIKRFKHNHLSFLLSERTPAHQMSHILLNDITTQNFIDIDLNNLTDNEIDGLINIVEKNGLWQKRAKLSQEEKKSFISDKCNRHLSQFIIQLVKSEDLESRYNKVISAIKNKADYYHALLYIIIAPALEFKLKLTNVVDDLGYDSLNSIAFKKNKYLNEVIDFDKEEIEFKSSILSNYILKDILNYSDVITPYIKIFELLHKKRDSKRIRSYLKSMNLYNNLNKIFRKEQDRKGLNNAIFTFYEKVSYLEYNRENPLFWLQFSMARLADADYPDAKRCFDNAYSYAEMTGFDTYQIDNHYARYLLQNAIHNKYMVNPIEVFRDAHQKLMTTKKGDEYKYYSYRVALNYLPYYEVYYDKFSSSEKVEFLRSCSDMLERVKRYLSIADASKKDIVADTSKRLQEILSNHN